MKELRDLGYVFEEGEQSFFVLTLVNPSGPIYRTHFGDPLLTLTDRQQRVLEILQQTLPRRVLLLNFGAALEAKRRLLINEFAVAIAAAFQGRLTIDVEKQLVGFLGRSTRHRLLSPSSFWRRSKSP